MHKSNCANFKDAFKIRILSNSVMNVNCKKLHSVISNVSNKPSLVLFTRNSSRDEIANVNFLCDDIVHVAYYKIQ